MHARDHPEPDRQPRDHLTAKRTWGAFAATDLAEPVRGEGITDLPRCAVATCIGVQPIVRHVYQLGFNVTLAVDPMADIHADVGPNSLARIFLQLGETGATQEIIDLLGTHA